MTDSEPRPTTGATAFVRRHRVPIGVVLVLVCAALTVLWWFVVPGDAETATGVRAVLLRAGHSVVWALLGVAALLWTVGASSKAVERAAGPALAVYGAFVLAMVL